MTLLTEADAKKTRCCGPDNCGRHDDASVTHQYRWCIASGCMAWRLAQTGPALAPMGYCGLAGRVGTYHANQLVLAAEAETPDSSNAITTDECGRINPISHEIVWSVSSQIRDVDEPL